VFVFPVTSGMTRFDKTRVTPGSEWLQTLIIRNNGSADWPAITNLRVMFSSSSTVISLPATQSPIPPDGCVKVDAKLVLPSDICNGTLVSFVLATQSGQAFSDVLTIQLNVDGKESDPEPESADWQIISDSQPAASLASSVSLTDNVFEAFPPANNGTASNPSVPGVSAKDVAMAAWARIWKAELEVLAEMGFTDADVTVPVLQRYIDTPASAKQREGDQLAAPSPEGIQDVVMHLLSLSRSGAF